MNKSILILFLIIIFGCKENEKRQPIISDNDFTILKYHKDNNWIFENAKPTNLTEREMEEIEPILIKAIAEHNENQRKYLLDHNEQHPEYQWTETGFEIQIEKDYYRQYVPVIDKNGDKVIWINFLCNYDESYETEIPLIQDGGNCYFNLKINLTKKTYYELGINSVA
ncbi:hypothetical protein [Haloflavibacter putidus]|uniref:Uncharacterized protein n=1 Tax=Haloflavibacter putidus TaxID=2576776 RepID=A0A507Z8J4_9FLAO|nr:hypothetical protein [Haloflavibacter putidus]TQD34036.1 hypothetical protein FKR84_12510 [Haloflavibacter putidus]